ncbi:MAG: ornithine carbamoyltransferase [Elusimicrobia bacterium RIFOXYA2_FULL_39_19]|nr:MAG: ornithine carbamoyltransferase [Elusimicrobia bacterium RIFOXYA2_FULL_39_19]
MKKTKDLLSVIDFTKSEFIHIFNLSASLKEKLKKGKKYLPLTGKTLAMIFQKPSTRTRTSFEVGMTQLGGHAIFLSSQETQVKRGETFADTARTLSRYVNGIMVRADAHNDIIDLAKNASVPIINGLSDMEHPCQIMADIFTIIEKKAKPMDSNTWQKKGLYDIKITYIGDGNNVANSLLLACAIMGMKITVCTPKGYEPDNNILDMGKRIIEKSKGTIEIQNDPFEAVKDSDVLYTDVWTSMGKEKEKEERMNIFKNYQINKNLISKAKPDVLIMHCLPAHRGEEISTEVMDGPNSIVFDQAENRLHVQKAILVYLLG